LNCLRLPSNVYPLCVCSNTAYNIFHTGEAKPLNGSRDEDGLWSVLRVSYDSLAEIEQKMFLDAATVFHGAYPTISDHVYHHERSVHELWKGCGWPASSSWENLVDRCLVTVGREGRIDVHEVLRNMGRSIACPDSEDVITHTRIWDIDTASQLCDALSSHSQQCQVVLAMLDRLLKVFVLRISANHQKFPLVKRHSLTQVPLEVFGITPGWK
jgi:hypothetical protein